MAATKDFRPHHAPNRHAQSDPAPSISQDAWPPHHGACETTQHPPPEGRHLHASPNAVPPPRARHPSWTPRPNHRNTPGSAPARLHTKPAKHPVKARGNPFRPPSSRPGVYKACQSSHVPQSQCDPRSRPQTSASIPARARWIRHQPIFTRNIRKAPKPTVIAKLYLACVTPLVASGHQPHPIPRRKPRA